MFLIGLIILIILDVIFLIISCIGMIRDFGTKAGEGNLKKKFDK